MSKKVGLSVLLAGLLGACSGPPPPAPSAPPPPKTSAPVKVGVLNYVTGDVSVKADGEWTPVDVGDQVSEASTLKTGKGSACDVQFGQLGVLHISENTVVLLKTVGLSDTKKAVDLQLVAGTVTAKVSKLLQDQRFQVQTNTVVCGVRGTRFLVSQNGDEQTKIAVAEGSVALVPPTFDPKAMEDLAKDPGQAAKVQAVLESILAAAPTVTVGKEVEVTPVEMKKQAEAVTQIQAALAVEVSAPASPTATPTMTLSDSMRQALESYQKTPPPEQAPKITTMSDTTQKVMAQTAELKIVEAPVQKEPSAPVPTPASPASTVPATPAVVPLKAPKLVAPIGGAKIDILVKSSITFQWKATEGATGYTVSLLSADKTVVKTWDTDQLSVVLDKFDKLQPGTFIWQVVPLSDKGGQVEHGSAAQATFQLEKKGQLSAPVLDLGGN